ncbi:STAS domain-containing protein [Streptomyces sp. NPDC052682]|uniref:STAS domain-containing protein n=1 Tax=Streptomyces sp. NPDC052682 TaxID=3154954 RepID=UPI00344755FC
MPPPSRSSTPRPPRPRAPGGGGGAPPPHRTAAELRQVAREVLLPPGRLLLVDLSGMRFCDSSGLTALLALRNQALAAHAGFALAAVPDKTARILRMTGLDQVFDMFADVREACARRNGGDRHGTVPGRRPGPA